MVNITIRNGEQAFTVAVKPSDFVLDLKHVVQSLKNIAVAQLRFFFWGKELNDDQTMSSCGIVNCSILHMAVGLLDASDIMITLTIKADDKSTTLKFLPSDTGRHVKYYMEGAEGYSISQQHLFFEGTELKDERSLSSYNIKTGSIVNLRVQHSSAMQVHIQMFSGQTASFKVHRSDTIKSIHKMMEDKWGISASCMLLMHAGKQFDIKKPDLTLADYKVQDGDNMRLVFRLPGGA